MNQPDSIKSFSWFNLAKIKNTGDTLLISFGKMKFNFVSPQMNKLYNAICDILPRILLPTELKSAEFIPAKGINPQPTGISCLIRLQEKSNSSPSRLSASTYSYFKRFLTYQEQIASLSKFPDPTNAIPLILDSLSLCSSVKEIIIPSISRVDSYGKICNFIAEQSNVEHIEVEGSITKNFDRYLHNIEANKNLNLKGLTFTDSRMTARNLEILSDTLKEKGITSLGLKRAVSPESNEYFLNTFLGKNIGQQLSYLNLDKTSKPDVKAILQFCPNLQMLSLANCNLDISQVAANLTSKQAAGLKSINLSFNACKSSTPRSLRISPTICHVMINSVTWGEKTLPEFIQTLTHSNKQGLHLSLSDADATTDEWIRLFSYFRQTKFTGLHSLVWTSNPVHNRLFDFLAKNKELVHLDLSGCFIQQEKEPMQSFANYLSKCNTLKSLILKGNSTSFMGNFVANILVAVESAKTIKYLDISGNKGGNVSIDAIRTLINGRSAIESIVFDGCEPESPESLMELLNSCTKSVTNAAVSFPASDIETLLHRGKISQEMVEKVKSNLMFQSAPTASPFDAPFYIYHDNPTPQFPSYLRESILFVSPPPAEEITEMYTLDNIEIEKDIAESKPKSKKPRASRASNVESNSQADGESTTKKKKKKTIRKSNTILPEDSRKEEPMHPKSSSASQGKKRKTAKSETKEEDKDVSLEENLESILPDTSELGEISTYVLDVPSENDSEDDDKPKKVTVKKESFSSSKTAEGASQKSSNANNEEDHKKKKKVSKRKKKSVSHSSQLPPPQIPPVQANEQTTQPANGDDVDWRMPVQYTFFDGMEKLWRHANLRYGLQALHNELHAMRPEKK
ncbi:hypothetical protein TVAG_266660 [Trichomonas vaginalis G3]|uniref:Leucine Rich Repeat family protein n=2 Tax=Trichomonas vaginalis (strain ATCC PRA-98 / G3) TaxID=412133 RepID=A2DQL9_TRIV3|nr:hypothetical protein TVAG_266660 [Trichomonas vaginalis G3]|eukprot:XP_001329526.1 hypothetical protein [Trichomonas vaginalis G3]